MKKRVGNGLYFVDNDFNILYFNDAVKEMYPETETGKHCYSVFGKRNNPCPYCPLYNPCKENSFYNATRSEWIHAQAAELDLPMYGKCNSITFFGVSDDMKQSEDEHFFGNKEEIIDAFGKDDRTGMIGGYCEEGFPLFFVNNKMIQMLGYDDYDDFYRGINGLVGNTIHPDDMPQVMADLGTSYYVGLEYETTYRMPRKDGTWFWTYDKGKVVEAENGRLAVVSYCTDISDFFRKNQQIKEQNDILQKQNRLMEFINDGMPGGYYRCDISLGYRLKYVSNRFLKTIGFSRDELKKFFDDNLLNLIHPDDRAYFSETTEGMMSGNDAEVGLHYRIYAKGGYLQVLDTAKISKFEDKFYLQGIIIDMGSEKQSPENLLIAVQNALEDALKRETIFRHRLDNLQHEIMDSISCGVIAYTLPNRKLLAINDAARDMIGCKKGDDPVKALKTFLLEKVVPEDKERVLRAGATLKKNGDMLTYEYGANLDGKIIRIHSNIKYLDSIDEQSYILVTMLNITEQAILTREIEKERKIYIDALRSGSEFSFIFDITEGVLREEFVTAGGVNLVKDLGFSVPVSFDDLLGRYIEKYKLEFSDESMKEYFTCDGLKKAFENGTIKVVTEYYNPTSDAFFRINGLLSSDEVTGHLYVAVVVDDVTEIRKKG